MKEKNEAEILGRVAAYCSMAERCIHDVRKKMVAAGASPESQERIIKRLIDEKFIDEARFCRSFVNDKLRFNEWGRIKTGYELKRKGISQSLIDEALDDIDDNEYLRILMNLLKRKKRAIRSSTGSDVFLKLCRYAGGKGFEKSLIIDCVKSLCKNECPDDDWE